MRLVDCARLQRSGGQEILNPLIATNIVLNVRALKLAAVEGRLKLARDLVAWLSSHAPPGTRIHFLPNNWEYVRTYRWYREAGELRADITVVDAEEQADWIVITHERRFARYAADLAP